MVKLTFVGDIFPANLPYSRNCGVAALDFNKLCRKEYVSQINKIIDKDSFFAGNLESPILPENIFSREMQFAGHSYFLSLLKEAGVCLLSLANNHILEHGIKGLDSTKKKLERLNIDYIGTKFYDGLTKQVVVEKNGIRFALVAYNAIDNQKDVNSEVSIYDVGTVTRDVAKAKRQDVDFVFVILHWGDEYIHRPSAKQIDEAHLIVDAGANFVVCSHPHVIQPVEEYHGGLICYSLGNFIFDMTIPKSAKTGMVVDIELSKKSFIHHERFVRIEDNFFPVLLEDDRNVRRFLWNQAQKMIEWQAKGYSIQYNREKKLKRLQKRISEKKLLIKNWRKYTPAIRHELIHYYLEIFKHGKN